MTRPETLTLLAILFLLGTAIWRVVTGRSTDGYHLIWATGLMVIGLALLTDLNSSLGAAASAVVLVFFIANAVKTKPSGTWTAPTPNGSTSGGSIGGGSSTSSSSGSGATPTPSNPFPGKTPSAD